MSGRATNIDPMGVRRFRQDFIVLATHATVVVVVCFEVFYGNEEDLPQGLTAIHHHCIHPGSIHMGNNHFESNREFF